MYVKALLYLMIVTVCFNFIQSGGSAMEIVAMDMKLRGMYIASTVLSLLE